MENKNIRLRFAPSPTGMMHLGNVRTALMNYLFAKQKNGTFVLRIEDTDPERNFDPEAKKIIEDLHWLGLNYNEGPVVGGPYKPYFQSQRAEIYTQNLKKLIENKKVYRCFCTTEELDKKRQRQIALKKPPRYDRACAKLTKQEIQQKLDANIPFIWRMKLDHDSSVAIQDITHGKIVFELKNFSDFPLTRQNGTFTFMFSNFVDDMVMKMTHVVRGEDHLSNTAGQAALYEAFGMQIPVYWHMPILCNIDGKKLSKRDFGFAIRDLKNSGYLPEAICNYLAILGASFEDEIMSIDELIKKLDFEHSHAKGQIKYDVQKLNWVNHKWITQYDNNKLANLCLEFLIQEYPEAKNIEKEKFTHMIEILKPGLITLNDIKRELRFFFEPPKVKKLDLLAFQDQEILGKIKISLETHMKLLESPQNFVKALKQDCKNQGIKIRDMFCVIRTGLMGSSKGPGVGELIDILGTQETKKRLESLLEIM